MPPRIAVTAALAALLVAAPEGSAQDLWRQPQEGVRHLHRRAGNFDYHVVLVDLGHPRVAFVATEESFVAPGPAGSTHVWRTTSSFARASGADIAINANYFDIHHGAFTTCGLAMAGARAWTSAYIDRRLECWWSVGFGARGRADIFDSHGKVFGPAAAPWMTEVVTGSPRILAGGEVLRYRSPRHALSRNPRTAIGLSADRRTLFLMVVNGREGKNQGMTCPETARALRDLGAMDAVNLDGGGSSALWIRAEGGLVNRPSDRFERAVANHLGVVFRDPPPPVHEGPPPLELQASSRPTAAVVPAPVRDPEPTLLPAVVVASNASTEVVRAGCSAPRRPHRGHVLTALAVFAAVALLGRRARR